MAEQESIPRFSFKQSLGDWLLDIIAAVLITLVVTPHLNVTTIVTFSELMLILWLVPFSLIFLLAFGLYPWWVYVFIAFRTYLWFSGMVEARRLKKEFEKMEKEQRDKQSLEDSESAGFPIVNQNQ